MTNGDCRTANWPGCQVARQNQKRANYFFRGRREKAGKGGKNRGRTSGIFRLP
jgi:hypothetical protein